MNTPKYKVLCAWCGTTLFHACSVPNSSGICLKCAEELKREDEQHLQDYAKEERQAIIHDNQPICDFVGGLFLGGFIMMIIGALFEWYFHH